ncbi:neuropeptide Y receptor type 2-like [Diaphorina citri]|uniref:Neuropeptide Y receptor type 2-like n=1 Tax=Diaphorina citri TaxID=121845 RepID=A0A1S3DA24_DIACI|nr:neuropeptide Y receptor type 2-like [Diaphorina citri]
MDGSKYYESLAEGMKSQNFTIDFTKPHIKPTLLNVYVFFIILYGVTILSGVALNIFAIYHIIVERLFRDATCGYFINIALADIIKCMFVLPITLMVTLVQNWTWGSFLCYFLPMLQTSLKQVSIEDNLIKTRNRNRHVSQPIIVRVDRVVTHATIFPDSFRGNFERTSDLELVFE